MHRRFFSILARKLHRIPKRGRGDGCFRKANASQGAQAYLQYVEHPGRVQRGENSQIRARSRDSVQFAGWYWF